MSDSLRSRDRLAEPIDVALTRLVVQDRFERPYAVAANEALNTLLALVESQREDLVRAERRQTVYLDMLEREKARVAVADDLLRRLSEWDMLFVGPGQAAATADAPYWQAEIVRARAGLFAGEGGPAAEEDG